MHATEPLPHEDNNFTTMTLYNLLQQQLDHEKNGRYMEAQECRIKYEKEREHYEKKSMEEMTSRHRRERENLESSRDSELGTFREYGEKKIQQWEREANNMREKMTNSHRNQLKKTQEELERTVPSKLKESVEVLNLRKMQEHLAKQKNYVDAHQIQQKIAKMIQAERQNWDTNRKIKIETALNTLKNKQKLQMTNLEKRINTAYAEINLQLKREEDIILLKYENFMRDLKKAHEKEVLIFKGEFKNLGGIGTASSSPTKSRSSFGSNMSR